MNVKTYLMMHRWRRAGRKCRWRSDNAEEEEEEDTGEQLLEDEDANKMVFDEENPVRSAGRVSCEGLQGYWQQGRALSTSRGFVLRGDDNGGGEDQKQEEEETESLLTCFCRDTSISPCLL